MTDAMIHVLLVEDEEAISMMLAYNLEQAGYRVTVVEDGEEALSAVIEHNPDLVVLDWMLPSMSGVNVCQALRRDDSSRHLPVIMLTARGEESDKVLALESGADDYMVKPFSPKELIARIQAVLRRVRPLLTEKKLEYAGIVVDAAAHKVNYKGSPVKLGPTEFRLLGHFMEHPGQVFSRNQLLDSVWGHDVYVEMRTVDVHIRRLRKALSAAHPGLDKIIQTIHSAGYKLEKEE